MIWDVGLLGAFFLAKAVTIVSYRLVRTRMGWDP